MGSTSGFCYSDVNSSSNQEIIQNHIGNHQIHQRFESHHHNPDHMFHLSTSMDMNMNMNMIGFAKHLHQQQWKPNNNSHPSSPSSSKIITTDDFYFNKPHQSFQTSEDQNLLVNTWEQDNRMIDGVIEDHEDSSLRCGTVFPSEGNERPSQGLSLSLSSTNPSTIGLQSFQLIHTLHQQQQDHHQTMPFIISNSKYLGPTQQLLNEFCGVETKQSHQFSEQKPPNSNSKPWDRHQEEENGGNRKQQSLCSLEFMDLQKRKTKLLLMLQEMDRRYRHYCDQMKAVVSSFEAIAGEGAANVYSSLASKAMSRHFRCLRNGIIGQIQTTKKAMGDKDPVTPGTTRGETPRLRMLDQSLRQQKALQQMTMMESHPWRPQRGLPERSVSVLRAWLFEHFLHPYPSDVDKHILARQTGLSKSQVSNWFINARVRLWKPMVEEMYMEEIKEHEDNLKEDQSPNGMADIDENGRPNPNTSSIDQKPTPDQLVRIDHGSLSSIIHNNQDKNEGSRATRLHHRTTTTTSNHQNHDFGSFGGMELDFSSYNQNQNPGSTFGGNQIFNGGSGVSLTLGLQQHGGNGEVSLAFSPTSQSSLFYTRDHIEDCQQVGQYSLLDGEGQNLPYRNLNLMGAQLLHDLAG